MTDLRTAAQQAREAWDAGDTEWFKRAYTVMDALRAALATGDNLSPTEPVAWQWLDTAHFRKKIPADATPSHWRPLYTAPPQRKPLTDEEIDKAYREICRDLPIDFDHTPAGWIEQGIRYAERAHGITS